MKMKHFLFIILSVTFCYSQKEVLPIIPKPLFSENTNEQFTLNSKTKIIEQYQDSFEAIYLKEHIKKQTGLEIDIESNKKNIKTITLQIIDSNSELQSEEAYSIKIANNEILINALTNKGLFYGVQSLLQLIPYEKTKAIKLQGIKIIDQPKFSWRGMHLDVCRHFFSTDFIKKYIDYLALLKLNTFHWHLTEDQGWRIEIKKYPKLTSVGAWRNGTMIGAYNDQKFDTIRYGGYYTQEEIKDIVAYAQERHITIVPEIEMPGHALAALAAYPELACTNGPFEVAQKWGVFDDVYCPKEETFTFLQNVLDEVVALFPSEYIHIGGDESPKTRWKNCNHCQNLIKKENLKDEHELQTYFITRIEKYLNTKGRQIIGWDEILEGGLAPNAAVMSWRGTEGGIAAAKQNHNVVMSPSGYCYFDHYQGNPKNEPLAIGGHTTLEKVYGFNPIPEDLSEEEQKYILGAQANVWTEYILNDKHVEYMIFPRIFALSEVVWGTSDKENYENFEKRVISFFPRLEKMDVKYSKAIYEVSAQPKIENGRLWVQLKSGKLDRIRYTLDKSELTNSSQLYTKPIEISTSCTLKAAYFEDNEQKSTIYSQDFYVSKSTGRKIELSEQPNPNYFGQGATTLVNGIVGETSNHGSDWIGFSGKNLEAIIDFEKQETISKYEIQFFQSKASWIYYPQSVEIFISNDGNTFNKIAQCDANYIRNNRGKVVLEFPVSKARYVKTIAKNYGKIPEGEPGSGTTAWLFVDEIEIH